MIATMALLSCSTSRELANAPQKCDEKVNYEEFFTGNTMRFDFHHAGDNKADFY